MQYLYLVFTFHNIQMLLISTITHQTLLNKLLQTWTLPLPQPLKKPNVICYSRSKTGMRGVGLRGLRGMG